MKNLLWIAGILMCSLWLGATRVHAEVITSFQEGMYDVVLTEDTSTEYSQFLLTVIPRYDTEVAPPEAFILSNPTRLVFDVPGLKSRRSYDVPINHRLFSTLRIGSHQDKTRIVVDILGSVSPTFQTAMTGNRSVVAFSFTRNAVPPASPDTLPQQETPPPVKTPIITPLPYQSDFEVTPDDLATPQPAAATPPAVTSPPPPEPVPPPQETEPLAPAAPVSPGAGLVRTISFQRHDNAPAVRLEITGVEKYLLSKKASNIYEITFSNTRLAGENLTLPLFPPEGFRGFEGVALLERGSDSVMKIYTEEDVSLAPFRKGSELWIVAE